MRSRLPGNPSGNSRKAGKIRKVPGPDPERSGRIRKEICGKRGKRGKKLNHAVLRAYFYTFGIHQVFTFPGRGKMGSMKTKQKGVNIKKSSRWRSPWSGRSGSWATWVQTLDGKSGVYIIRESQSRIVLYVGQSHTGRLKKNHDSPFSTMAGCHQRGHISSWVGRGQSYPGTQAASVNS